MTPTGDSLLDHLRDERKHVFVACLETFPRIAAHRRRTRKGGFTRYL